MSGVILFYRFCGDHGQSGLYRFPTGGDLNADALRHLVSQGIFRRDYFGNLKRHDNLRLNVNMHISCQELGNPQ